MCLYHRSTFLFCPLFKLPHCNFPNFLSYILFVFVCLFVCLFVDLKTSLCFCVQTLDPHPQKHNGNQSYNQNHNKGHCDTDKSWRVHAQGRVDGIHAAVKINYHLFTTVFLRSRLFFCPQWQVDLLNVVRSKYLKNSWNFKN